MSTIIIPVFVTAKANLANQFGRRMDLGASVIHEILAEYNETENSEKDGSIPSQFSVDNMICFCCEDSKGVKRAKRAITVSDPSHSKIILQQYRNVANSIDCTNQDPITVHLKPSEKQTKTVKSAVSVVGNSNHRNHRPLGSELQNESNHRSSNSSAEKKYYVNRSTSEDLPRGATRKERMFTSNLFYRISFYTANARS